MASERLLATSRLRPRVGAVFFFVALAAVIAIVSQYMGSEKQTTVPVAKQSPQRPTAQKAALGSQAIERPGSETGPASWYDFKSRTASGEEMDAGALTAAHPSLAFGTAVLVENLSNGRSVVVRVNDRGPFTGGRIIDVSKAAAARLGMIAAGTATVRIHILPDAALPPKY
jgi:rare lipoprotein A